MQTSVLSKISIRKSPIMISTADLSSFVLKFRTGSKCLPSRRTQRTCRMPNLGAFIVRLGFWARLYYFLSEEPQGPILVNI